MRRLKGMLEATMDVYTFMVRAQSYHNRNVSADTQQEECCRKFQPDQSVIFSRLLRISGAMTLNLLLVKIKCHMYLFYELLRGTCAHIRLKRKPTAFLSHLLFWVFFYHPPSPPLQRSSMTGVPLLNLQGALDLRPDVDPLQNEALVQMWLEVKIKPLLKSITKQFLSCLSTKNFSCSTYQTVYVYFCIYLQLCFSEHSKFSSSCLFLQGEGTKPPFF